MCNCMATVSLKIRLNYNQILELTQQLSDDDKLELSRALAVETRGNCNCRLYHRVIVHGAGSAQNWFNS